VIEQMIGKGHEELEESYLGEIALHSRPEAPVVMEVTNLSSRRDFTDVSLQVRAGEVLGIYGFMGCGVLELARALFGKVPPSGTVSLGGQTLRLKNTAAAKRAGIAFVPESRRSMLFHHEPIYKNTSISILGRIGRLWLRPGREREIARSHVDALHIRTPDVDALLGNLSGGNQQKVALSKWLTYEPKVLILSEPTRGMDVGAKEDVVRSCAACATRDRHHRGVDRAGNRAVAGGPHPGDEARPGGQGIQERVGQQGPAAWKRLRGREWRVRATRWRCGRAAAGAAGSRASLRNIAPFLTLLFLVIFFSAASPTFLSGRQFLQHPQPGLDSRRSSPSASPS
jgi:ABC-type branched-subunit amino acid transport system ATPase component